MGIRVSRIFSAVVLLFAATAVLARAQTVVVTRDGERLEVLDYEVRGPVMVMTTLAWEWRAFLRSSALRDTPPEVERMMRERLMAMSPEERFVRGAIMFDAARAMVLASLDPELEGLERKRALYERIYRVPLPVP